MVQFNNLEIYRNDVFSQNGEDGIISELLRRLELNGNLEIVEFGACDGIYLSNTFNLIKKKLIKKAVYIEADKIFYEKLKKVSEQYSCIVPINKIVEKNKGSANSLENILNTTEIKKEIDLLSIDIDSYDLDVFLSLEKYNPKILIIEVNRMPLGIYHRHNEKINGNSFSETILEIKKRGMWPVVFTGNIVFVDIKLLEKIKLNKKIKENSDLLYNYHNYFYKYKSFSFLKKLLFITIPIDILNFLYKIKKKLFS